MASNFPRPIDSDDECQDPMGQILSNIGLKHLASVFRENMVGPQEVENLGNEEFQLLGVSAVGDRVRLKQACRNHIRGTGACSEEESNVVKKFLELQSRRQKTRKRTQKCDPKKTRRFYVGWKHLIKANTYMLIPASKGGGQQIMDVPRECSLQHLLELVMNTYFPGGKSEEQNLEVADLNMFVASFSGRPLPEVIGEKSFTVGTYFDSLKSYPVRIYLHTKKKEQADASTTEHVANSTGTDDLTDTGTPTIVFNERPRRSRLLELRQRITQMTSTTDLGTLTEHHIPQNVAMADEQNDIPSDAVALISDAVTGHQLDQGVSITDPLVRIADDSSEFHLDQDYTHPNLDVIREDAFTDPQLDQDESNLQAAIQASLGRNPTCAELLKDWISSNLHDNEEESVTIIVHRRKILDSTRRAVSRTGFSFFKPVKVIFAGEIGEDSGGPKREYYRLLMKEIKDDILEGTNFQHSISKLENKSYWYAGRCIAWSILQGGSGFPFLSHTVFGIVTGDTNFQPNLEDVTDLDAKSSILKIQDATSLEDVEEISDWILEQGLPLLTSFDEESKVRLVNLIIKNSVYYRLHAEIAQFQTGLNLGNFLDIVTCHKGEMSSLFTHMRTILTVDDIKGMLQINYSPDGSNDKQLEDDTIYSFEVFLQDCMEDSADVTLCDLLAFWTGASEIPPLGFHKKLEIDFVTDAKQLPVAHTCGMSLELPRGVDNPDELKRRLVMAVEWGGEFHLA